MKPPRGKGKEPTMNRNEIYNTLDRIEDSLLEVQDNLDVEEIDDDIDYSDIIDAISEALTAVQNAMQATHAERFNNR